MLCVDSFHFGEQVANAANRRTNSQSVDVTVSGDTFRRLYMYLTLLY